MAIFVSLVPGPLALWLSMCHDPARKTVKSVMSMMIASSPVLRLAWMLMVMGTAGSGRNGAVPTKAGLEALAKHSAWKSDPAPAFLSALDAAVGGHGRD
jgi:hypothetical protein